MAVILTSTLNQPRIFTLKDKSTLRFQPLGTEPIKEELITKEIERNIAQGLLVKTIVLEKTPSPVQAKTLRKKQ